MSSYYARDQEANTDGTPLFASDYDRKSESETAKLVEARWDCEVRPFGRLCPVDFYAIRDGRLVGLMELKSRSHASDRFPTVFLNVRKWLALMLAQQGLGVPALFLVRFTDGVRYQSVASVDASRVIIGGARELVKSHSDIEPVILVPVDSMKSL